MPTYNPGPPFRVSSDWSKARKHPTQGTVKRHEGQDWAAPAGTPIPAAADGHVIYTGWMNGYGNTIAVEHMIRGQVVHTMYAHMSAASPLKVKDKVKKGDPLGPVGMTGGVSSGNHLHFEVHPFAESGKLVLHKTVDPATFDFPDGEAVSGAFGYPFLLKDGEPARSLAAYMHAMRGAEDGFYPVGGNSLWHGGIHFGDGTANALAQGPTQLGEKSGVRCIADGEVVAYKLDSTYPAVQFRENQLKALYSTGFTLVRHTLVLPESTQLKACQPEDETADLEEQTRAAQMRSAIAVKMQAEDRKAAADAKEAQKAAAAEAAKDAKKGKKTEVPKAEATPERTESKPETLVLFSLYMHLMDWRGYRQDEKIPRAKYWKGDSTYRVPASAARIRRRSHRHRHRHRRKNRRQIRSRCHALRSPVIAASAWASHRWEAAGARGKQVVRRASNSVDSDWRRPQSRRRHSACLMAACLHPVRRCHPRRRPLMRPGRRLRARRLHLPSRGERG